MPDLVSPIVRPLDREVAARELEEVSELLYQSGPEYYDALLGSHDEAVAVLSRWMRRSESGFATDCIRVARVNDRVAGVGLHFPGAEAQRRQSADFQQLVRGTHAQRTRLVANAEFLRAMSPPVPAMEYYFRCLAIAPEYRRQGIARMLLNDFMGSGIALGYHVLRLDVLSTNVPALRLYESVGFAVRDRVPVPGRDFSVLSMVKSAAPV